MNLAPRLRTLFRFAGVDRPIAFVLLSRAWSTLAGVATLYMVARFLRAEEQGFYYTFSSIIGLQIFFDLGFSYTVMQCVSHEKAHLIWTDFGTVTGNARAKQRLAALLRVSVKWYGIAALVSFAVLLPAGLVFFRQSDAGAAVSWQIPWAWLALVEAIELFTSPFFAFLEGSGLVAQIAFVRLVTSVLTAVCLWLALWNGWALFASPIVTTVTVISTVAWAGKRWWRYFADLLRTPAAATILNWRLEVWPFQWRMTVTWFSFYFMSQLAVPVLFRYQGSTTAGQMGLSISLILSVQAVGLAWMTTKAPQFGMHVARQEFAELDRLFFRALWQALVVLGILSAGLLTAVTLFHHSGSPYRYRTVSPLALTFLLGRMLLDCGSYFLSVYLRAHKQEPLLGVSVANAAFVAGSTYLFGRYSGAEGMAAGNFAVVLATTPVAVWIFSKKRREWHSSPSVLAPA